MSARTNSSSRNFYKELNDFCASNIALSVAFLALRLKLDCLRVDSTFFVLLNCYLAALHSHCIAPTFSSTRIMTKLMQHIKWIKN